MKRLAVILALAIATTAQAKDELQKDQELDRQDDPGIQSILKNAELTLAVGQGYNNNIYEAPSSPYINQFTGANENPTAKSGSYTPVLLRSRYRYTMGKSWALEGYYRFSGDFYTAPRQNSGDLVSNKVQGMLEKQFGKYDYIAVGGYFKNKRQAYVDHDTGIEKSTGTVDLSQRYDYSATGFEAEGETRRFGFPIGLNASYEDRTYVYPGKFDRYDYKRMTMATFAYFRLNKNTKLKTAYQFSNYDYLERRSRDLTGNLGTSPARQFVYNTIEFSLRYSRLAHTTIYVDYAYTDKSDKFVGYFDYAENQIGLRILQDIGKRFQLRLKPQYWQRSFPHALAYDIPAGGGLKSSGLAFDAQLDYAASERIGYWLEAAYNSQDNTDERYAYQQTAVQMGVRYTY